MVRSSSLPPAYYDTNQQNQAVVELTFTDIETGDEYAVNKTVSWSGSNTKAGIDQAVDEMRRQIKYGTNEDMQGEFEGYEVVSAVQRSGP